MTRLRVLIVALLLIAVAPQSARPAEHLSPGAPFSPGDCDPPVGQIISVDLHVHYTNVTVTNDAPVTAADFLVIDAIVGGQVRIMPIALEVPADSGLLVLIQHLQPLTVRSATLCAYHPSGRTESPDPVVGVSFQTAAP